MENIQSMVSSRIVPVQAGAIAYGVHLLLELCGLSVLSFSSPLWGRDREGSTTGAGARVTPLPNPPPQGGREQNVLVGRT
jgi:hypothetical protein